MVRGLVRSGRRAVRGVRSVGHADVARLDAYRWFQRAVLISIFFGQVFVFYREQLLAIVGLVIDLIVFTVLKYMIGQEVTIRAERGMLPSLCSKDGKVAQADPDDP